MENTAELNQSDRSARTMALDVSRSFIVQAPAGSGKTELLIQRFLKLLTVVERPEEILAITFTRKAASEMRHRVSGALQRAAGDSRPTAAHELITFDLSRAVLERDLQLGWNLPSHPGRLQIETVDAFCSGIARSLPVSSGIGGVTSTLADASMSALYQQAAVHTLDWLTSDSQQAGAVRKVLVHLDNNTRLYSNYLASMLATREQWLPIIGGGMPGADQALRMRRYLERNLSNAIETELRKVSALIGSERRGTLVELLRFAAGNLLEGGNPDHPVCLFADAESLPAPSATQREHWQAVPELLLTKQGHWRKRVDKNSGFPPDQRSQKQDLFDLIEALSRDNGVETAVHGLRLLPQPQYSDEQWEVLLALLTVLPLAIGELRNLFSQRGVVDHAQVSLAARQALGDADHPGDIAMALDYKIHHVLVDEMQDTSIGQYELIRTLIAGWQKDDGRTAFCVGDPMQSIYRFRDAEVGEFLQARQHGIGTLALEPLVLRRNFRSGENLVHWFNTIFGQIMPVKDDLASGAIAYAESVPVDLQKDCGNMQLHPLFDAEPAEEAAVSAVVIEKCLSEDSQANMAVLVRSRTQLPELLLELRNRHIEYQAVEIDRLTDLPEVADLTALTRALCDTNDRLAWLALLRAPWVAMSWAELHALVRNDPDSSVRRLLNDAERCAGFTPELRDRAMAFTAVIDPLMARHATQSLRDRVERAWIGLGGPAILADPGQIENAYRYLDVLDKIGIAGSLEDPEALERLLEFERVSSTGSDIRLQVMTMHKAKGLEFDHVLLHGLGRQSRNADNEVLGWLHLPGNDRQNDLILSPVGSRAQLERDPLHGFIAARNAAKQRAELDRLLYVACTRARKTLHLVGSVNTAGEKGQIRPPPSGTLLRRLWPALEAEYLATFELSGDPDDSRSLPAQGTLSKLPLRCRHRDWVPPALPAPAGASVHADVPDPEADRQVEYYWVGSSARHAGTLVHRWLQRISETGVQHGPQDIRGFRELTMLWATEAGVAKEQIEEVYARVTDAVRRTVNDSKGSWILFGQGYCELAVTGVHEQRIQSIVIDRIRVDDDGTHWIIDYKTSAHEGGDLPGFLQQETERYRDQLAKYARMYSSLGGAMVRTALYFPLLQAFCEVKLAE